MGGGCRLWLGGWVVGGLCGRQGAAPPGGGGGGGGALFAGGKEGVHGAREGCEAVGFDVFVAGHGSGWLVVRRSVIVRRWERERTIERSYIYTPLTLQLELVDAVSEGEIANCQLLDHDYSLLCVVSCWWS
jgi:hypothetical protein